MRDSACGGALQGSPIEPLHRVLDGRAGLIGVLAVDRHADPVGTRPASVVAERARQGSAGCVSESHWCVRCHRLDSEPAGEECKNPEWHAPAPAPKQEQKDEADDWV